MYTKQGTYADIYDLLCEGKVIQLEFPTRSDFESFRIGLHKYRTNVAKNLEALGESTEKAERELVFTKLDTNPNKPGWWCTARLAPKTPAKTFSFTILS